MGCLLPSVSCFASSKIKPTLSIGYYHIDNNDETSESFYTLSAKAKYKAWRFGLSQPYARDNKGTTGLANATVSAKYLWNSEDWQIELGIKQKMATASRKITLPVSDRGLFTSFSTSWNKAYFYIDAGYWWREKTDLNRKNAAQWGLGGFYPIHKKLWIGLGVDQSESAIQQNKERLLSLYWQIRLSAKYKANIAISKGLTEKSPDYFAGLQLTRRF